MAKKRGKTETRTSNKSESSINKTLIENFVNLQKVLTNLSIRFDELTEQISKLLQLFEISAKSFAEKSKSDESDAGGGKDTELLDRLDTLLDQNKTIAKGLTLMEEKLRERRYSSV